MTSVAAPCTVLVLVTRGDPRNEHLASVPPGVRLIVDDGSRPLDEPARQADAILAYWVGRERLKAALADSPRIRWVHSIAAGVDGLLFPELADAGLVVTNSRGVFSESLAEFAILAMLYFAKDVDRMRRSQAARRWDPFEVEMLHGRTLGVVGYGDIGRASAGLARAFGMQVLALRRTPEPIPNDPGRATVVKSKLELIQRSDYVLVAAPLTQATRHMISSGELAAMKPTAVIINVGRGPLIDEQALVDALRSGRIRGAALDVFETEPLPSDHPLFEMPNVFVSPHCADRADTWLDDAMHCFLDNLARFRRGEHLENVIDVRLGY